MMPSIANAIRAWLSPHRRTAIASAALFTAFLLLTVLVHLRLLEGVDLAVARTMYYGLEVEFLILCATVTGLLGATQTVLLYSMVASLLLWRRGVGRWSLAPMAFLFGITVEVAMKIFVDQPLEPLREFHRGTFYPFVGTTLNGTFPSGHALRATFFCSFLAVLLWSRDGLLGRWASLGMVILALVIGFTRLYIGDHWLSDVVGGLLLGSAIALLVAPPVAERLVHGAA